MNDKQKAELMWKVVEFVKTLSDDRLVQIEILKSADSFISNSLVVDSVRLSFQNLYK